jgi:hypothetical protein
MIVVIIAGTICWVVKTVYAIDEETTAILKQGVASDADPATIEMY